MFLCSGICEHSAKKVTSNWSSGSIPMWSNPKLFGKSQTFRYMILPSDSSWTLPKIVNLEGIGQSFIKWKIRNGQDTFLWLDHWHPLGPLYEGLRGRVVFNLGRFLNAKGISVIDQRELEMAYGEQHRNTGNCISYPGKLHSK